MEHDFSGFFPDLDTWIIADTHFFHANIGRYCDRPDGWQDLIVANWNRLIGPGETVFHLGDLALGKREQTEVLIPKLNGTIYLMRGNHDRRGRAFFEGLGIQLVKDPLLLELEAWPRLIFSHRPVFPLLPGALNLHGHIHNNPHPEVGPRHVNMSIEVRDYRPWRLGEVLQAFPAGITSPPGASARRTPR
jgi:calcineurin-like phosphoesterase family protein